MVKVERCISFICEACHKLNHHSYSLKKENHNGKFIMKDKILCECGFDNFVYEEIEETMFGSLNNLEKALLNNNNYDLDSYLEIESTDNIRRDINDIKQKATISTESGIIKSKLEKLLSEI